MINYSGPSISYKGLTGHWTKWGGARKDVFARQNEDFDVWYCQVCQREMTKEMNPYFYEWEGEYLRVCAICIKEECMLLKIRIKIETVELEL